MIVGVPAEHTRVERRVALVPASVDALSKAGLEVAVERGAGVAAGFRDADYEARGARLVTGDDELLALADLIACLGPPRVGNGDAGVSAAGLRPGQLLIGLLSPFDNRPVVRQLAVAGVTAFSLELLPRSSRAQAMDALSSMATIAGYKAVLLAAAEADKMFPMMITAAGTLTPAKVLVVGAGVAGLQAIATARRLGAVVTGFDIRPAVKEQVESLGARFLELELATGEAEDKGGYAAAMDEEFYRRQRELMAAAVADSDVVITTAAVPGKRAPLLITTEMVRAMTAGSVIVDLAAETGGNCELTRVGETQQIDGVTVIGPVGLPATVPEHASQMYSRNVAAFILNLMKDGKPALDADDEIIRDTMVTRDGAVVNERVRETLGGDG